jgi:LmbE family N-acetylglucosaminyl deacetylase
MLDELSYLPAVAGSLPAGPWLVISPHPDDETFGLGGALLLAAGQGAEADVLILTSGEQGGGNAEMREQEAREAAARLRVRNVWFWRLPDRSLQADPATVERLAELIAATRPGCVFFPSPVEPHPDHRAASAIAWEALRKTGFPAEPWSYEVSVQGPANRLIDITRVVAQKREIMDVYASQAAQNHYTARILGLNQARAWSLPLDASHAEAFCVWPRQDKPLNALLLEMEATS